MTAHGVPGLRGTHSFGSEPVLDPLQPDRLRGHLVEGVHHGSRGRWGRACVPGCSGTGAGRCPRRSAPGRRHRPARRHQVEPENTIPAQHRARPEEQIERQCVPRRGRPEDAAALVVFLVAPSVSFIAGRSVHVDGGRLLH
ncbi:SDR family oxidoreductase [Streptomyces sp. NPDC048331]|uniref:SDR family oxidoreductase n=1 Tax=Streptomyces sp. NPDC048331 TaxID=3365534 RepID=UPI00371451D4